MGVISFLGGDEAPVMRERTCTPSVEGIVMIGCLEDGESFGRRRRRKGGRIILHEGKGEVGVEEWVVVDV